MTKNGQYLVSPYSANGDHITESQKQCSTAVLYFEISVMMARGKN